MRSCAAGAWATREGPRVGNRSRASSSTTASLREPVTESGIVLRGERTTAAATASRVRVLEGEAGTHHRRDVVDRDAVEVLRREGIDEDAPAFLVEDEIVLRSLVFNEQ